MDKEGVVPIAHRNDVTGRAALDQASLTAALQSCEIMEDGEVLGGVSDSNAKRPVQALSVCLCLSLSVRPTGLFFFFFLQPKQKFNWNNIRGGRE